MLTRLIESRISAEERCLGEKLDYLKYMVRTSRPAFFKYIRILPMANYRRVLTVEAYHIAAIMASMAEGCGNCVQIEINMARAAGVNEATLQAVAAGCTQDLDDTLQDVYEFTNSVLRDDAQQEPLRLRIVERFGDRGLVELSMKIAVSRLFPMMTRTLGFSSRCSEIDVGA